MSKKMPLLVLAFLFATANASDLKPVEDQSRAWLLKEVDVLLDQNNPYDFPAILRIVSTPAPLDECEPNPVTEEACSGEDLYLVLSNWDIAADVHAFEIGRADAWRVGELVLHEKKNQSAWTASLTLESDKYAGMRKVTETMKLKITNTADQYTLDLVNDQ